MGKATIIGMIDEDIGLIDKENCLLVQQGNPDALAEALHWAAHNRDSLSSIGAKGLALYRQTLSIQRIQSELRFILEDLLK